MGLSPDELAMILAEKGIDHEAIAETVSAYAKGKYDGRAVEIKPSFFLESDKVAKIGNRVIKIRAVNQADTCRMLVKVTEFARQMIMDEGLDMTPEQYLNGSSPQKFIGALLKKAIEFKQAKSLGANMYPDWYVAFLEEIAMLATFNPDDESTVVTINDLVSCSSGQFAELLAKIWEVSKQDFLDLLGIVESNTGLPISILVIQIMKIMSEAKQKITEALKKSETIPSSGGQESTGNPSISSPSKKEKTSRKKNLAGVA